MFSADIILRMSVRLNVGFQEDLKNSSSALYKSYKTDLETAVGYGSRHFFTNKLWAELNLLHLQWVVCLNLSEFMKFMLKLFLYLWDDDLRTARIILCSEDVLTSWPDVILTWYHLDPWHYLDFWHHFDLFGFILTFGIILSILTPSWPWHHLDLPSLTSSWHIGGNSSQNRIDSDKIWWH